MIQTRLTNISVFLIILLISCSGPHSIYDNEYALSSETVQGIRTGLTVSLPDQWYAAEKEEFDIWLVKNDLSNTIIFQEIHFSNRPKKYSGTEIIKELLSLSKTIRKVKQGIKFVDLKKDEFFELNGRNFGAYEYADKTGGRKRVVVFEYNGHFFEVITAVRPPVSDKNIKEIFALQNSVLRSIK